MPKYQLSVVLIYSTEFKIKFGYWVLDLIRFWIRWVGRLFIIWSLVRLVSVGWWVSFWRKVLAIIFRAILVWILHRMRSLSPIGLVTGRGLLLNFSLIYSCTSRISTFFCAFFIIELVMRYFLLIKSNVLFQVCFTSFVRSTNYGEEPFIYFNFELGINFKFKKKSNSNPLITKKYSIEVIFAKSFIEIICYYQHILK